ncbi:hypothetical protein BKH43_05415 [Helicobacter sp. 13S00401-1]|nr:hypothetical protein BKH43_05415 [Helicobacter sp. 13S00401-1]
MGEAKLELPSTPMWQWDAYQVAYAIRNKKVSSVEVTKSVIERIKVANKKYNSLAFVLEKEALANARYADELLAKGIYLSPLHGVPISIKNNTDVKGVANTDGIVAFKNNISKHNAALVENVVRDGAIIVGVSNVPEFTFRWFTENPLFGKTLNPWNKAITCGGSSGGAASATTSGMGFIAHGNDIAGSIRYPAYACGCVGLRTTPGRVPRFNPSSPDQKTFSAQFFTVDGPLARSVRDCEMGFRGLAKASVFDPNSVDVAFKEKDFKVDTKIIGVLMDYPGLKMDSAIKDNLKKTATWLSKEGYIIEPISLPFLTEAMDIWARVVMNEVSLFMLPEVKKVGSKEVLSAVKSMIANTPKTDMGQYMMAIANRETLRRNMRVLFEKYHALMLPVSLEDPMLWGEDTKGPSVMKHIMEIQSPLMATTTLGLPIMSVPTGLRKGSLGNIPEGVQIVADEFREDICFEVGEVIERNAKMPFVFS